jgi:hypothetical protein
MGLCGWALRPMRIGSIGPVPGASVEAFIRHGSVANAIVLSASLIGLTFAGLIAGRILMVVGHAQRAARDDDA